MEQIKENLDIYYPQFDDDLKAIIASNGRIQRFKAGDTIMQQGEFLKHTMLIVKGRVKLLSEGDEGEELFMYYLEAGQ
ncbi:MAG: cyclic nucleotide-binding domain-containing protein, partial [Bacteroidia bacterium]|nr:cyclic nucleotide-binding domain-containing protein [Bacteroidia bacterium]